MHELDLGEDRLGSSPRAWGGCLPHVTVCVPTAVHPHVRGAVCSNKLATSERCGSSPRAWGGWRLCQGRCSQGRFIPTCVGRFLRYCTDPDCETVHPHVRGAVWTRIGASTGTAGSSPRAWGGLSSGRVSSLACRFIPTCVGRFRFLHRRALRPPVHPHVRGAVYDRTLEAPWLNGSSPRAWGGWLRQPLQHWHFRFIPTCVGRFRLDRSVEIERPVHPHVRGAVSTLGHLGDHHRGSSPRAWGGSLGTVLAPERERFIPTCVGRFRS